MGKKLYIGNLPFDIQEDNLREFCAADGRAVASVQIIMDRMTGRSRGFGFVEYENADDAKTAIDGLNGKELNGRALTVSEAREPSRSGGDRGGYKSGGQSAGGYSDRGDRGGFGGGGADRGNKRTSRW